MKSKENLVWHIPKDTKILVEEYGEEAIVYNSKAGSTHQLNEFALDVLATLEKKALSLNALVEQITKLYPLEDRNKLFRQLSILITQFDGIGLIEPFTE